MSAKKHPHQMTLTKPPKADDMKATVKRIWSYMIKEKGKFYFVLAAVLISSLLSFCRTLPVRSSD